VRIRISFGQIKVITIEINLVDVEDVEQTHKYSINEHQSSRD